ncbi:copper chaperone PCu(A)C [Mycobacterium sp. NPDC049093]
MAETVQVSEQWASAADGGMTAVFGTLTNTGHHDARIVSATSPAAGTVELHEVVSDGGSKTMRPKEGGLAIVAGSTHELAPGGDHLMLMDLKAPLQPGADVPVSLVFEDGSSLPITAQVRDFAGGNENYQPPSPHGHG